MINGRVLLDGAPMRIKGALQLEKVANERWLIHHNSYCIFIEKTPMIHGEHRNFDITILDEKTDTWEHCIITFHAVARYKQRWLKKGTKLDALVDIIKTMLSRIPEFSICMNRVYYKARRSASGKQYKAFAYEMLEDGTIIYKTFFPKPKTQCK